MRETIARTTDELAALLTQPGDPLVPALLEAAAHPERLRDRFTVRLLFEQEAERLADIDNMPQLSYTLYRDVQRHTDRIPYQRAYSGKRARMTLAALKVLLGDDRYVNVLHDYVWSLCEQTTWVLPQVEQWPIELRAAAVALDLAEIVVALEGKLEERAIQRVRDEIEHRIFLPYLADPERFWWYRGHNNWTGVCNGAIGAACLHLERDPARLARALSVVLAGLDAYIGSAFEEDGTSSEGVGYWRYGLSNLICFSEMLRHRTRGAIDILSSKRMRQIARYPLGVMLSAGHYFAFSDCNEMTSFNPGLIMRLAERIGVDALRGILAAPAPIDWGIHRFHEAWRGILWWDGTRPTAPTLTDTLLPSGGIARLVAQTPSGAQIVVAAKAGHNGVPHNHNDVGTFVLHVDGETYLCDPERGLYDLYRRFGHDANVFANSYGHSVPRIGETLQSRGSEFGGEIAAFETGETGKHVQMTLDGAYEVAGLERIVRTLGLEAQGELVLEDRFTFSGAPLAVEEAFVTWLKPIVSGRTALLIGEQHVLQLTIEAPAEAVFRLEVLAEASTENHKPIPLKRLSFLVGPGREMVARVRATVLPQ